MAIFPTPSDLLSQYKTILKNLKPDLNVDDATSEPIIRGKALTGILSGLYGDQLGVNNDTYVGSARPQALGNKGSDLNLPQQPATFAQSPQIQFSGTVGQPIPS